MDIFKVNVCYNKHMDNKAYLEQIASETRASKPKATGFLGKLGLSPKMKKLLIGGAIIAFIIIIIGSILSSGGDKNSERDLVDKLSLRTTNLISVIEEYNPYIKSSKLRSLANSLKAVLGQVNYAANTSLADDFDAKNSKPEKEQTTLDEDAWKLELQESLTAARLNGILDRKISPEYAYQIGMLISLENDIINKSKKDNLKTALNNTIPNLDQLYDQFDNFAAE